ncbi:imidazole glycerol phosphate synthase subunit HisH [Helicobacter sp. 13S00477-4]|uniref:imidazole glycerol phosphate synthase subunit HisH n=1 Tax=Helicobacter sp. 13S00477-4 TaxID=1905759 RepID=UPI000BA6D7CC|nr:imidazole glycerol phosphate synthase subunit HisH [Helicobacter sp. 13S00477-4]PAF50685.1 imidazole glycerol phosphate synthase, glutamine amidotransferase subunit [Helicobacter sp. 13S00477-4]
MKIGIINYNMGNLANVKNAFETIGIKTIIENNPSNIPNYDKLILPGVGAFGDAILNLQTTGMKEALIEHIKKGKYILGICLGMQLLFEKSKEFGEHSGLELMQGEIIKFETKTLSIPHTGWNQCHFTSMGIQHPLVKNIQDKTYLYFVHSYHATSINPTNLVAQCFYGEKFPAIVAKENILGIQAHPEKSHQNGLKILSNFAAL